MKNIIKFCLLCGIMLIPVLAFADQELAPISYTKTSPNKQFLFVMIFPEGATRYGYMSAEQKTSEQQIKSRYRQSGLYRNDDSTTPLWTVGWYARNVLISSDGVYLITRGPWATTSNDEALTFFANGKLLRSYQIKDLVGFIDSFFLPRTVSHFRWEKSRSLDDEKHTLTLFTLNEDAYVFDITTGEIVSSNNKKAGIVAGAVICILGFITIIICACGIGLILWKKTRHSIGQQTN